MSKWCTVGIAIAFLALVPLGTFVIRAAPGFPPNAKIVRSTRGMYPHVLVPPTNASTFGGEKHALKYPLVVSLHGSSLRGNRLSKLTSYGTVAAINAGMSIPAYVLAPQCPSGQRWNPHRLDATITEVMKEYPIDTARIYVIGMSMGGYGTFDVVGTYPERFAAAIAMCGGGQVAMAGSLARVPLWVIHGAADRAVPSSQSRRIVNAIQATDGNICYYTEIPGLGHGALAESYGHLKLYDWLLRHTTDPGASRVATMPPTYSRGDFAWRVTDRKKYAKTKKRKRHARRSPKRGRRSV